MKSLVQYLKEQLFNNHNEIEPIDEMALELKKVRDHIEDKMPIFVTHLCLCVYSKTDLGGRLFDHWFGECVGFVRQLTEMTPKSGNIHKTLKRMCINLQYNEFNTVLKRCRNKFNKEHIDKNTQEELVHMFIGYFDTFIDFLTTTNEDNVEENTEKFLITITPPEYDEDTDKFRKA